MDEYYVIVFSTTNFVIQAESVVKSKKIPYQIMPTPREITLSCGMAIRFDKSNLNDIAEIVKAGEITIKDVYRISGELTDRKMEKVQL